MTPKEQGGKTAREEPPTRLYLSAYQGQFFDEDVEYVRLESVAEFLGEVESACHSEAYGLEEPWAECMRDKAKTLQMIREEIRDGAHHEGER